MSKYQLVFNTSKGLMKLFNKDIQKDFSTATSCYQYLIYLQEHNIDDIKIYKNRIEINFLKLSNDYIDEMIESRLNKNDENKEQENIQIDEYKIQILYDNKPMIELGIEKDSLKLNVRKYDMYSTFKNSRVDNDFFVEYEILARAITMVTNLKDMERIKSFMNEVFSDSIKKGHVVINYF